MQKGSGYITVYLSLTLGILISLITTMLYGARIHTIRFEAECAMDMGLDSIFAEYHREMLRQYGLLFIDSSYGSEIPSDDYVAAHLINYMNMNFDNKSSNGVIDITATHADNGKLANTAYASDASGEVLRYQIGQYMKNKRQYSEASAFLDGVTDLAELLARYDSYAEEREAAEARVIAIIDDINSRRDPEEELFTVSNPADAVDRLSVSNALFYAFGNNLELNYKQIDKGSYIAARGYRSGAGLTNEQRNNSHIASKPVVCKYLFGKCGYWDNEKYDSALNYQIEYILKKQDSDIKNIGEIVTDIFKIRYVINMMYLLSDSGKQSEAEAVALIAASILAVPELVDAIKYTILFAWGYVESAKDLRMLFSGNKLPMLKNSSNWNTPLYQLVGFRMYLDSYSNAGGELGYEEFLKAFLLMEDISQITLGLMDIMEMDIRLTPGNSSFRMDGQIYQSDIEVNLSSSYGYGCTIKRFYSYE